MKLKDSELRDDFAKTALQIILAHEWNNVMADTVRSYTTEFQSLAEYSYEIADAMMKAREK